MRKKLIIITSIIIIVAAGLLVLFNTNNLSKFNQSNTQLQFVSAKYVKKEVEALNNDHIIFPDIDACPILILEPKEIDADFYKKAVYGDRADEAITGYYNRGYKLENIEIYWNDDEAGSVHISNINIDEGLAEDKILENNIAEYIDYAYNFANNLNINVDKQAVWVSDRNPMHADLDRHPNHENLVRLVFEKKINGINLFPDIFLYYDYQFYCMWSEYVICEINEYGIKNFRNAMPSKIKEVITDDADILSFSSAKEIYNDDFAYAKFYYINDIISSDLIIKKDYPEEPGSYDYIYDSFERKTIPVWVFFKEDIYDYAMLDGHSDINKIAKRVVINALTGEIIKEGATLGWSGGLA